MKEITKSYAINRIAELEQENAELKKEILSQNDYILQLHFDNERYEEVRKENAELKAENERLKKDKIGLHSEIKQLEQENAILKAEKEKYYKQTLDDEIQINELLQTLQEIKKIAENGAKTEDYLLGQRYTDLIDRILDLITKSEVEK